jgi:hypothetical protein
MFMEVFSYKWILSPLGVTAGQLTGYMCMWCAALCCAGDCSGWLWVTIAMNESELLATAGMDALVRVCLSCSPQQCCA